MGLKDGHGSEDMVVYTLDLSLLASFSVENLFLPSFVEPLSLAVSPQIPAVSPQAEEAFCHSLPELVRVYLIFQL